MEPATHPDPSKRHERVVLAQAIVRLFELWGLPSADRLTLLGLSGENRTALQRYGRGEPLAASRDLLDRGGHLLGIHKSLKLLYPRNEDIVRGWMSSPNERFGGDTPVEVVRRFGLPGLVMVRGTLDVMRGH
ncbi:MAG: antitoxin Xre/MbcA/ParS toxin-binding domain-containing protein [Steroidobacteraceae bacterium]